MMSGSLMEIEAKFQIDTEGTYLALQSIQMVGEFTLGEVKTNHIQDSYLDTTDRQLLAAGYAFRQRRKGEVWVVALKGLGGVSGAVHRREELELHLESLLPPVAWPSSPLRTRILDLIGITPLGSLFSLTQTRQVRAVYQAEALIAWWSLDAVQLQPPEQTNSYFELEIELTEAGSEAALAQLVQHMQAEWGLQSESRSKFERGLATIDGQI